MLLWILVSTQISEIWPKPVHWMRNEFVCETSAEQS